MICAAHSIFTVQICPKFGDTMLLFYFLFEELRIEQPVANCMVVEPSGNSLAS
jgi:hypothetical protein